VYACRGNLTPTSNQCLITLQDQLTTLLSYSGAKIDTAVKELNTNRSCTMKSKFYNVLLIATSLIGYLQWGGNHHLFLFQAEGEIVSKLFTDPASVLHPLTLLPMIGQLILVVTLFQKVPGRVLTYIGIGCLAILLGLMFVIGVMDLNYKILFSTLPFMVVAVLAVRHFRLKPKA